MTVFPARATDFDRVPGPHDRRWRLPGPCRAGEKHISAARGLSASPRLNLPLFVQEQAGFRCIRARNRAPAGSGWGPRGARAESIRSFRVHSSTWPFSLVLDVEPRPFFSHRLHGAQASGQQCAASTTPVPLLCNLHANTSARRAINYPFDSLEQFFSARFLRRSTTTGKKAI